jgi:hypothetical protein
VRVPWIRAEEGVQGDVTANPWRLPRSILCLAWDRFTGLGRPVCDPSLGLGTGLAQRDRSQGLPACEEASATSAPPQHRRTAGTSSQLSSHTHACAVYRSTSLRFPAAACGVAPLVDRERRAGCSMDSSCELLSSLDAASGSVHCCQVPCRTARCTSKHHQGGGVQRRASGLRLSGGGRLTEKTREAHGWCMRVWGGGAVHCCDSHLNSPLQVAKRGRSPPRRENDAQPPASRAPQAV